MNIIDLPDEILIFIINKLTNLNLLYSLVDVNQRFNRLVLNSFYTHHLDFTTNSLLLRPSDKFDQYMNRICQSILPRIHHQVNKLTLRHMSIPSLLHTSTFNFPQLHSLSLVLIQTETFLQYLTCDTLLHHLLRNQIKCFYLNIDLSRNTDLLLELEPNLFVFIISLAKHLTHLTLIQRLTKFSLIVTSNLPTTNCMSSILTKLEIDVRSMDECHYLLDGRFNCLSTLIIEIKIIVSYTDSPSTEQLPKLKCFSLTSFLPTVYYDDEIIPLLRRMSNLEELTLYLRVIRDDFSYIDGHHLSNEIFIHTPRLNKFIFSISNAALNLNDNLIYLSNDDIQRSFIGEIYPSVGSYTDQNSTKKGVQCHIHSLPYQFDMFHDLNNSFQGDMVFEKVHWLVMCDKRSFEHEFFRLISRCFPYLQILRVENNEQQINKRHSSLLIRFPHLTSLDFIFAHPDYVEQFLLKRKSCVPRLEHFRMKYESLVMFTNHFTNDAADLNCTQLSSLFIDEPFVRPDNFHSYFPRL